MRGTYQEFLALGGLTSFVFVQMGFSFWYGLMVGVIISFRVSDK